MKAAASILFALTLSISVYAKEAEVQLCESSDPEDIAVRIVSLFESKEIPQDQKSRMYALTMARYAVHHWRMYISGFKMNEEYYFLDLQGHPVTKSILGLGLKNGMLKIEHSINGPDFSRLMTCPHVLKSKLAEPPGFVPAETQQ